MKTLLFATALTGVIVTGATQTWAQDSVRPAKVFTVQESETALRRDYSAVVFPSQEVELSFRVSGRVIELPVRGATQVNKGDMIARLDPRDFEANIAQLESQRDQSAAQLQALRSGARAEEVAALEAAVAAAQAQVDQASDQAVRTRQLAERGVVAAAKLDQDEATLRVAQADLRAKQEQLLIGTSGGRAEDISSAEAALRGLEAQLSTARSNLEDATLTAPFTGIVARRDIENFTNVQAGQDIVLLQALSVIDLAFDVPGSDVITLSTYDDPKVTVTFDNLPGPVFDAELVEFSTQADAATQTYRVRVAVEVPEGSMILPGMVGQINVLVENAGVSMINVPLTAVAAAPDGSAYVWLMDPDSKTVSKQDVTLGNARGDMIEVASGLTDGDIVITAGLNKLQVGMTIRPITKIGG